MSLNVEIQSLHLDVNLLQLSGQLNADTVIPLKAKLSATPSNSHWIIDLTGVGFIDSRGIAFLISMYKTCRSQGKQLFLSGIQKHPFEVLCLCSLDRVFQFVSNPSYALQLLRNAS